MVSKPLTESAAWLGPALLVPVQAELLLLDNKLLNAPYSADPMNYSTGLTLLDSIEPSPFNKRKPKGPGATLQWALPSALTQGAQKSAQGQVEYPLVPNRWLITRRAPASATAQQWGIKAWVIESDYTDLMSGTNLFPALDPKSGEPYTRIGRAIPLDQWLGDAGAPAPWLRAVGPGDATFATFSANIRNVFSFYDDLKDVTAYWQESDGTYAPLTYTVTGWYSDPASDPLWGSQFGAEGWQTLADWQSIMKGLHWSIGDEVDLAQAEAALTSWCQAHGIERDPQNLHQYYPARSLYHGMVYHAQWPGADTDPGIRSGVPPQNPGDSGYVKPLVAAANTVVDAVAALITNQLAGGDAVARILEAFQYDLLPVLSRADASAQLAERIHNAWFGAVAGGTEWVVSLPHHTTQREREVSSPPLTPAQQAALGALNQAQQPLDQWRWQLQTDQQELYNLWWKLERLPNDPNAIQDYEKLEKALNEAITKLKGSISDRQQQIARQQGLADAAKRALESLLPTQYEVIASTRAPFYLPNDPVVLISGAHRSFFWGDVLGNELACRFTGQTISGISVTSAGATTLVTAADVSIPVVQSTYLALEVTDLIQEAWWLDTQVSPSIALAALTKLGQPTDPATVAALAAQVAQQQTLAWNAVLYPSLDKELVTSSSGLQGRVPAKLSVTPWANPWIPLFLDWEVTWTPAVDLQETHLRDWAFHGGAYHWTGPNPPDVTQQITYMGRTLLTPEATQILAARLEKFLHDQAAIDDPAVQPYLKALGQALQTIQQSDLLSQTLSGLLAALLMRDPAQHLQPGESIQAYLKDPQGSLVPIPMAPLPANDPDQFFPIRAGHFSFADLHVVDAFGQVFDPIKAQGLVPANFYPIPGNGMATKDGPRLLALPPRIAPLSRLNFDWLSATTPAEPIELFPDQNPVAGWLLPNHLDQALAIYDAAGALQGELVVGGTPAKPQAVWVPAPDGQGAKDPSQIANAHLRDFVQSLLALQQNGGALIDLLHAIDLTLSGVAPESADQLALAALVGRPLALVCAQLAYAVQGNPPVNQAWAKTGLNDTGLLKQVTFPVQLGSADLLDDGVMGYFLGTDYQRFHAVHPIDHPTGSGYVDYQPVSLSYADGATARLTLILDPRGKVHAISDILPTLEVVLPDRFVTDPLAKMVITFRTGPILTSPEQLRIPIPTSVQGQWAWLAPGGAPPDPNLQPVDPAARLPNAPPVLRQGWLQFQPNGLNEQAK